MMTTISQALSILSALALSSLILVEGRKYFAKAPSWRVLALSIALVNGLLVVLITELLSRFDRLQFGWILAAWALFGGMQILYWRPIVRELRRARRPQAPLTWIERGLIVAIAAIVLGTGITALFSAPNTWDALAYHLSRVAHWRQNRSVEFFPTYIERQLSFPPFAEYVILHLQLLTGGDRFAALVQWLSYIGTLIGVTLVAAQFGATRLGQLVSALFAATLPIAILEASSTQNDLVVSFWLLCFCYFSIAFVTSPSRFAAAAGGSALGLALLTKATAYLLVPGFAVGFVIMGLRRQGVRLLPLMLGGLVLAAGVPGAFYVRNARTYGEPIGSESARADNTNLGAPRTRSTPTTRVPPLAGLAWSLLRGAALHASVPPIRLRLPERARTLVESFERRMFGSVSFIPLDAADWQYTMSREDRAGAPFHLLLVLVALGALAIMARGWRVPGLVSWHVLGLLVGVLLLAALLRWNVYMVRFHMNLFLLAAPLVGLVATRIRRPLIVIGISALLLVGSVYSLGWNQLRPLQGAESIFHTSRREQYFRTVSNKKRDDVLASIDYLNGRRDTVVGIQLVNHTPEYPYWILLSGVAAGRARLCYVNVPNPSRAFESAEPCRPTAVVTDRAAAESLTVNDVQYTRSWQEEGYGIYLPPP